ncbi:MAG: nucleoside diphosphate kinase regulator [Bacteroidota bacterium]
METQLQITHLDYQRLNNLIQSMKSRTKDDLQNLEVLENEIDRAKRIEPRKITPEVVTMNSEIELMDMDTKRKMKFRLVYPQDADFRAGRLSVLSPLGSALIGYSVGTEVSFKVPAGLKQVRIEKILYQPEANGEYTL